MWSSGAPSRGMAAVSYARLLFLQGLEEWRDLVQGLDGALEALGVVERPQHDEHDRADRRQLGESGAVRDRERAHEEEERDALVEHRDRAAPVRGVDRAAGVLVGELRERVADRSLDLEDPDFLQRRRELGDGRREHEVGARHLGRPAADGEAHRPQDQTDEQRRRCCRDRRERAHRQRGGEQREQVEPGDRAARDPADRARCGGGVGGRQLLEAPLALLRLQRPVGGEETPDQRLPDARDGRVRRPRREDGLHRLERHPHQHQRRGDAEQHGDGDRPVVHRPEVERDARIVGREGERDPCDQHEQCRFREPTNDRRDRHQDQPSALRPNQRSDERSE